METVISYCTNDFRFIKSNVEQCLKFSKKVVIPVCDHFYDGSPENKDLLEKTKELERMGNVMVIPFEWNDTIIPAYHNMSTYWHNLARWIGHNATESEYVLHIDADEIFDPDLMNRFLHSKEHEKYDVCSFECYWYFRDPTFRAKTTEIAGFLFKRGVWTEQFAFTNFERVSYRHASPRFNCKENVRVDGQVVCNHFSWVRTKEEMLKKVDSWAHKNDRDWRSAIEKEFKHDFSGRDFVHGYTYEVVENKFNI